jgi:hypothetical protein
LQGSSHSLKDLVMKKKGILMVASNLSRSLGGAKVKQK